MTLCDKFGIPHSEFLSWDEDDQEKALLFQREQRSICGGCGTRPVEWERDRFAYISDVTVCPGCELLAQENKSIPEGRRDGAHAFLLKNRPGVETSDGLGLDDESVLPKMDPWQLNA